MAEKKGNDFDTIAHINRLRAGDTNEKQIIAEQWLGLVFKIAKQYQGYDTFEDILSEGYIGLNNAIDTYDPNKNDNFVNYAAMCIKHSIFRYITYTLSKNTPNPISLDWQILDTEGDSKQYNTLIDLLIVKENENTDSVVINSVAFKEKLAKCRQILRPREFMVFLRRYGCFDGQIKTCEEIAKVYNVTRSHISDILREATAKLQIEFEKENTPTI